MHGFVLTVVWCTILIGVLYHMWVPRVLCMLGRHECRLLRKGAGSERVIVKVSCKLCDLDDQHTMSLEESIQFAAARNRTWRTKAEELNRHYIVYNMPGG